MRLVESDEFPFEFLSQLAERESWRKEIHRPIYHVHKWWAKRLGSVFRGILLGCTLGDDGDLAAEFYRFQEFNRRTVFDPFMGSGTTVGEAHKLGFTALGRDINPVAVEAVSTALGPLDRRTILAAFESLSAEVGERILALYRTVDSKGYSCDVLYHFWVMQVACPGCERPIDLFPSYVIARNAYPNRKPDVQVVCPSCGAVFPGRHGQTTASCPACRNQFDPTFGPARGTKAVCPHCTCEFAILGAVSAAGTRPTFRHFAKLVLTGDGAKEYLPASAADRAGYEQCSADLLRDVESGLIQLPDLKLEHGHNTRQALGYAFRSWRDFFLDRQLLALGWLRAGILKLDDVAARKALLTLFSGVLEFNNLFASYKGEGTGAVRHMFSHHILKPERTPIEANIWGTPRSSGSFSNLFRGRLLRAIDYRLAPIEVVGKSGQGRVCAAAFSGRIEPTWPANGQFATRGIYLSCGDSADTAMPDGSVDLVVTDPPFFDNVHYSELADFFFAWQQLGASGSQDTGRTTRSGSEVQDSDPTHFARKLEGVFRECHRILKDDGLLVFTYHHSRDEGWQSLAEAVLGAGFVVVNSQPVKAEMSVATPKSQAKEPIQFDIIVPCRKVNSDLLSAMPSISQALDAARSKLRRLRQASFTLSRNDRKVVLFGQLLTTLRTATDAAQFAATVEIELAAVELNEVTLIGRPAQQVLFGDA
ncbi:MAG TPA: DNA methyltransferase [Pirellulales bacterium]|nr:DNA methyltransferase [Pirellulales bacterium]